MKKTILTTTLALGLGVGGLAVTDDAEASEQNINKEELAEKAQNHSSELDNAPLHEGEYHYNFNLDQVEYDFQSDGVNYTWAYNGYADQSAESTAAPEQTAEQDTPQVTEEQPAAEENVQEEQAQPVEEQPATQETEETQEAQPVEEQPAAPVQNVEQPEENTQQSEPAADGSTKEQFLAAGGTEAMWDSIVMPESSGDPNAVNELGYQGLGQTKEHWGTGSVETQTEGMIDYANDRYGSVEEAIEFRENNNWW